MTSHFSFSGKINGQRIALKIIALVDQPLGTFIISSPRSNLEVAISDASL